jgi:integrase
MATIRPRSKKDGSVSYTAEIRIKRGGKVVHRESKTWPKKRLAEQWAAKREALLAEPGVLDGLISGAAEAQSLTVAELIQKYIDVVKPLKDWGRTKSDTLAQIKGSEFGQLIASEVVAADLIEHCKNWGAGPSTMNQHYLYVKGVFAVSAELLRVPVDYSQIEIAQRVMSKLGIIAKSDYRDRRPTVDEMSRLVELALRKERKSSEGWAKHRSGLIPIAKIMVFAMFSGRRQAEIVRLRRSLTDYENQRVLVPDMKHPTKKMGNDVWVYVPDEAWRVLMSVPVIEGEDRYFPVYSRSIGDRFRRLLNEAGLWDSDEGADNLHFHDLRHEATSWLFERDGWNSERWDIPRVASVTGHQSWDSLRRYTQMEKSKPYNKWLDWEWLDRVCEC